MSTDVMSPFTSIDASNASGPPVGSIRPGVSPSGYPVNYVRVKHIGADTATVGKLAGFATTFGTVSMTAATIIDTTLGTIATPAGMYVSALTTNTWGWLQCDGPGVTAGVTDGGIAAGDFICMDGGASPDGVMETLAAGEEASKAGYALDADSGTSQVAETFILCCGQYWGGKK